ncbi:MAG: helix-turn-helix transcriptional regulator [Candidatus Woesearchaeota archaeon]
MERTELEKRLQSIESDQKEIKNLLLDQKTVLNFNELAKYTGLAKSFLYKLTAKGKIPGAYKPTGKQWFFERQKIDEWLLSNANGEFHE